MSVKQCVLFAAFVSLIFSCASTPGKVTSSIQEKESVTKEITVKKTVFGEEKETLEATFVPSEKYLFDSEGRELYFFGHDFFSGCSKPSFETPVEREAAFDKYGNQTYMLKERIEWFREYYPNGDVRYSFGYTTKDDLASLSDSDKIWYDKNGRITKVTGTVASYNNDRRSNIKDNEWSTYFEYDAHGNLTRQYMGEKGSGDEYKNHYDYDKNGNMIHSIMENFNWNSIAEASYEYDKNNNPIHSKGVEFTYEDDERTILESYLVAEFFASYNESGKIVSSKVEETEYAETEMKTVIEKYLCDESYEYDDSGRLVSHKKNSSDEFEGKTENSSIWESYEYADDGSYVYKANTGYKNSIMEKHFSPDGKLNFEIDKWEHKIWYDEKGRKIKDGLSSDWASEWKYNDAGQVVYHKYPYSGCIEETWLDYDADGNVVHYKWLLDRGEKHYDDQNLEIWAEYDEHGYPVYIRALYGNGIGWKEVRYVCVEYFYINEYSYHKNGRIKDCLQYRYTNRFEEWVDNQEEKKRQEEAARKAREEEEARDYVTKVPFEKSSSTRDIYRFWGLIAHDKTPVYKNLTHEFGEEPDFYLNKDTMVRFTALSKDSFQYKGGDEFHRWKIRTDDEKTGWVSGHDMIVIGDSSEVPPIYEKYLAVFGRPASGYTAGVTGDRLGSTGFYNGGVRYLTYITGDNPYYLIGDVKHQPERKAVYRWDVEAGHYVSEFLDTTKPEDDYRYVTDSSNCLENTSVLKVRKAYKSEEYYAVVKAIDENDMKLLKRVLDSGYKQDTVFPNESLIVYAAKKKNTAAIKMMTDSGFSRYVYVAGAEDVYMSDFEEYLKSDGQF